jgi:hypothetical protein
MERELGRWLIALGGVIALIVELRVSRRER